MRSVAVLQPSGDDVEKMPFLAPLLAPLLAAGRGALAAGGRALGIGAKTPTVAAPQASMASTSMVPKTAPAGQQTFGNIMQPSTSAAAPPTPASAPKTTTFQPGLEESVGAQASKNTTDKLQSDLEGKKELDRMQTGALGLGMMQSIRGNAQAEKQARQQRTMEAAQQGKEISSGGSTLGKSQYHYADWMLDDCMYDAWRLLKARMEIGPHDEQQDDLFEHLKNVSAAHSIRTNEDDNSFKIDDIHDSDEDIVRRLIESFGRSEAEEATPFEETQSNYF